MNSAAYEHNSEFLLMLTAAEMCNANGNREHPIHARTLEHMNLSEKSEVKRGKKLPKRH